MQPKLSPLLLVTAGLGVLALGGLAYVFLSPGAPAPAPGGPNAAPTPTPVPAMRWVARTYIPPRTAIDSSMFAKVPLKGQPPEGSITDPSQIKGEITNGPIEQGEAVTLASFTPGLKRVIPANIEIPRGFRAVAIYVDPTSTAAGLVDVGDYVDVIAVHRLSIEKGNNQLVQGALQYSAGRLIGSDLKVLAVDKSLEAPPPTPTPAPAQAGQNVENAPPPTPTPPPPAAGAPTSKIRVLLAAPVEIATRLVAANDQGTLHVTIRNPSDGDITASPEAHEYPSRIITTKPNDSGAKAAPAAPSRPIERVPDFAPMPTPVMIGPLMPSSQPTAVPVPAGPPTTDITVIRGTEKTRVLVPQRNR